jgi:sugar O-acyltransferase (sialic acid O-acetyltransferase NeuD family)
MNLLIAGAGGHGRVVADLAVELREFSAIAFLDDSLPVDTQVVGFRVIGGTAGLAGRIGPDDCFVAALGDASTRISLLETAISAGIRVVTLIHPKASVSRNANLGVGTVICAGAVVATGAVLGRGCIVNTCASVDHDCVIGDAVHICPGAHVAGGCRVGARTWIGMGSSVREGIEICNDVTVGVGAAVLASIDAPGVYVGVPAKLRR